MRPPVRRPSRAHVALAIAAGVLAMLLYAGQFVISRWSIQRTLSVWDLGALRFSVAGTLMLAVVARHGLANAAGIGWRRALVLGVTVGAPYTLIMFSGLSIAPASHGAVIIPGFTPVVSALLAWWWLGQSLGHAMLGGLAIIVTGLVLVSGAGVLTDASGMVWVGDLLFVVAAILWAAFTVLARRWHVDPVRGTAIVWVLSLAYLPVYVAFAGSRLLAAPRGEVVLQALYQGVGVAIVALALYAWSIRILGPATASLFMPLTPVFGVLLAVPTLGEIPTPVQALGILAVSGGMVLAAGRRS
ncbi:MAG: DMT family transporter [Candidatus Rokubacteria bacterium]|nr:DMT family transporter [Candidatus Rokubacteria bacterium]